MTNDPTIPSNSGRPPADAELDRLLSGLCDGTLSDEDGRTLGRLLATDPDARRAYLHYVDLHAVLTCSGPSAPFAAAETRAPSPTVHSRALRRVAWWAASIAATAAIVLVALRTGPDLIGPRLPTVQTAGAGTRPAERPAATRPVVEAQLSQVAGRVEVFGASGEAVEATDATVLRPGRTVRTASDDAFAALDFPDGSRVELVADTQLRLADDLTGGVRIVLSRGALRADVRPQPAGRPMVVTTPQAEVVVLGTQFTVSAGDATAVETNVGNVRVVRTGDGRVADVPAGHYVVAAAGDAALEVRSTAPVLTQPRTRLAFQRAHAVTFSRDGQRIVAASTRHLLSSTVASAATATPIELAKGGVRAIVSADGGTAVVVGREGDIALFDPVTGERRATIVTGFASYPQAVAVSPDGRLVAAYEPGSFRPGRVRIWSADGVERAVVTADTTVQALAFSPDGGRLAAATVRPGQFKDRRLIVWAVAGGTRVCSTPPLEVPLDQVAFSPDARRIAASDEGGAVHLWDATTGEWLASRGAADGWAGRVRSLAMSVDGRLLAAGGADGRVRLWDVAANLDRGALAGGRRSILAVAFSPDGRTLASGLTAGPVLLWDVPSDSPAP